MSKQSGSCLCGKVKFSLKTDNHSLSACHCSTCRKWSAGPLMTIMHNGKIQFENTEFIKNYNSSEWAERGFCSECGTHLYYHLKNSNQYYIAAWTLNQPDALDFNLQVYIDNKPECYSFANQTHNLTEADIQQMIAEQQK
ncbi:hypothetical protein BGI09_07075 [Snodgrassella alvi]|uniref:GFA family protein n=1 Tax=Snodgrassella alvi TaxID=1196083 RepID=UPI0009FE94D2|nr:GFA family protein [Snodgrassella alvi]ORF30847.1 hypothetical protein BGI09_07075 [Snodgrassella alvi]